MRPLFDAHRMLAAAVALLAAAPANALSPTTSRAELQRWFVATQQGHEADLGAPQTWVYAFVAADTRALEALSAELVRSAYRIRTLEGGATPTLRVTRVELHSPQTLVQLNKSLQQTARRHGARYESFGLAPP